MATHEWSDKEVTLLYQRIINNENIQSNLVKEAEIWRDQFAKQSKTSEDQLKAQKERLGALDKAIKELEKSNRSESRTSKIIRKK